jgi:hypothetical protein
MHPFLVAVKRKEADGHATQCLWGQDVRPGRRKAPEERLVAIAANSLLTMTYPRGEGRRYRLQEKK